MQKCAESVFALAKLFYHICDMVETLHAVKNLFATSLCPSLILRRKRRYLICRELALEHTVNHESACDIEIANLIIDLADNDIGFALKKLLHRVNAHFRSSESVNKSRRTAALNMSGTRKLCLYACALLNCFCKLFGISEKPLGNDYDKAALAVFLLLNDIVYSFSSSKGISGMATAEAPQAIPVRRAI